MVFESLVADILNKFVGDYVENLDRKQLSIGIWGGDVVLTNLALRENAFQDLDLPVQIVYGHLGKLVLKIPWKNLYSERVVAQVEDLYILVSPINEVVYNAEKEAKNALERKQAELEKVEETKRQEREKDKPQADKTFTEKLTAQIVNNLQIKISNVHIRYEDKNSAETPFTVGVTLRDLDIYTTDSQWVESYMTEQKSKVYKVAKLDSLSIYMNTKTTLFTRCDVQEFPKLFEDNIATKESVPADYAYVLAPITSMAKLQLNMNPQYDHPPFIIPKIDLGLDVDKLDLGLTRSQFQDLLKLGDSFNRMQLGAPYRQYRPHGIGYRGHYKEWWKFAKTCILETRVRKKRREWSWDHIQQHRKLVRTYCEVFKQKLLTKKAPASLIESVNLCEEKLDIFNLILIRERVNMEVEKIKLEEEKQKKNQSGSWFGGWFSASKKAETEDESNIAKKFEAAMTADEKHKLYQAIGYHEGDISSALPPEYVAIKMRFLLSSFEVCIQDEVEVKSMSGTTVQKPKILSLKLSLVTCNVSQRPAASAIVANISMKELQVSGFKKDNHVPTIVESQVPDEFNLLSIDFETNPLDKSCDQRLKLEARPLQIIYDAETIIQLAQFFTSPSSVNLSELEGAAAERLMNIKERSATGIQYMIDSHSKMDVHISLMPNVIIIPYGGVYISSLTSAIIVSLGSLDIRTVPRANSGKDIRNLHAAGLEHEKILLEMMKRAYDKFSLTINDIQILMARPKEKWMVILAEGKKSEMHLLRPIKLIIEADVCVVGDDPRLPKTKVKIEIPSIGINVTDDRVVEAITVVTSIPFPEGKTPESTTNLTKVQSLAASTVSLMRFLDNEKEKMAKKALANVDLAEEIVQYTDLDATFVLSELHISIYKAKAESDKETPSPELYKTPMDEFAQDSFDNVLGLSPTGSSEYDKILSVKIVKLEAHVAQRTYEMVASVNLGAIHMNHYDKFDNKITVLPIIDTPRYATKSQNLLAIAYTNANKISPEFITKYNSTEQLIEFEFSKLVLTLHQECLQNLLKLAADFQVKMEAFNKSEEELKDRVGNTRDGESIITALKTTLDVIPEEPDAPRKSGGGGSKRQMKVVESIKIKVNANLDQVAVIITCRKRPISHLKIKSFKAGVIMKSSYTELALTLRDIVVTDLNPKTIHTNILSIIGENALNVQVVLFNLDETANYNSDDMKITVTMGCVRIVFLNWFVTSVLTFLNNFQAAQQALADASAAAADAAKENIVDAYSKATRIRFDIKIKAPIIIVPVDSQALRAISLDLGFLCISNVSTEIDVHGNERSPAVVDEIKLELKDMKLSKATVADANISDTQLQLPSSSELEYGLRSNVNILDPISILLVVNRNLSASWYKEQPELDVSGRLNAIELNLFVGDYVLLMSIMSKNLTEGQDEFPQVFVPPRALVKEADDVPTSTEVEIHDNEDCDEAQKKEAKKVTKTEQPNELVKVNKKTVDVQLKFNFQIDGLKANLINASNEGLASVGFYVFSLKGQKLADGTLSAAIVLCDIQLVDIRPNSDSLIKKFLRHKKRYSEIREDEAAECAPKRPMVDIIANIKDNDTFAEVRICGFDLIISIDFLTRVADFFKMPDDANNPNVTAAPVHSNTLAAPRKSVAPVPTSAPADPNKRVHLVLHLEEPDIILVENMVDLDTYAIIFNSEVNLKVRMIGEKQIIFGEIKDLKMYMCSFHIEQRENTKHYIIHPCTISLRGSTPEGRGLNIHIKFTDIIINISPVAIELINKALATLATSPESGSDGEVKRLEYNDLWGVKNYTEEEFWFMKIKEGVDASLMQIEVTEYKPEECIIEIPLILLVIESGIGYYTSPMLMLDTKMNARVNDWSQKMSVTGFLTMSMAYYNSALAVWEPLIEENERKLKNGLLTYGPWELSMNVKMDTKKTDDPSEPDESMMEISVRSDDTLELTVTKTALELLKTLGQAFSQAMDKEGLVKPEFSAPYILQNDTGFDITINFAKGPFTLHECHLPSSKPKHVNSALVFQTIESQPVTLDNITTCTVSPGGKVYMKTKIAKSKSVAISNISILSANTPVTEELLYVQVGKISKEVAIPIHKADERYFPLYRDVQHDPWGIVSSIKLEYGSTVVTIQGVVKVRNHFTIPVTIHRISHEKFVLVGEVQPGEDFNVPLHAIYAPVKDLHFSFPGYKSSVQGFNWKESPSDLNFTKSLQCDPVETFESLYITAIREKQEIYHELTSKHTLLSAVYTIHLKPPLYLRNALPISMKVSVAGCSVGQEGLEKGVEVTDTSSRSLVKEEFLDYGEKAVSPGDVLHLPTFKLKSSSGEGHASSYIVVRLIQYLEKDWSCTTEISEDHDEFAVWRFTSYDSVDKMDIELGVKFENRKGSLMLTIYCPFLMINKTGLMLSYRKSRQTEKNELSGTPYKAGDESINVLYHPPSYEGPILFSFREKLFFGKKRASIRVDNGEWSDKFPLDVAGSAGVVECKANDMEYQIAVHNHFTQNSLTKMITFLPFYVLINKAFFTIEVREDKRPADTWIKIPSQECVPLWPRSDSPVLRCKAADHSHISRPFKYSEVQCTLLMMKNKYGGINVDVQVSEGGTYVTFTDYHDGDAPGLIMNHTSKDISFWEKGNVNKRTLKPWQRMLYTWSDPAGDRVILWDSGKQQIENDLRRDGVDQFFIGDEMEDNKNYWVSFLSGTQRVLLFTNHPSIAHEAQSTSQLEVVDKEIVLSLHGIGLSIVNNLKPVDIVYIGIASSGVIWESRKKGKTRFKQMKITQNVLIEQRYQEYLRDKELGKIDENYFMESGKIEVDFDRMILHKTVDRELRRTHYPGIWVQLKTSPFQTQLHAKINRIQIDDQLPDCVFPVVLAPVAPPRSLADTHALRPFIECSVVERVIPHSTVKQFKYASVLIQEFHVKVDLMFISELSEMFSSDVTDVEAAKAFNDDIQTIQTPLKDLVASQTQQEQKHFYDNLHLGPLKMHVSFSMAGSETTALPGILSTILQGVGVTLTDINDIVFRLSFFEREYQFFTQRQLTSEIVSHYAGQAVKQLYVLVLGLDVLGNPYGLVVGIKKGVEDLFYEPFQGAIQGPGEFAEGLVLGVKSLFGHTVGGAAGAVSKITGAMGKGLAALTFDKDYQRKRREQLNKKPATFSEGIARSGKGLVMGVFDGVTGVVTKPIAGAKQEGVEGFFKGLGKGAVGLVARPTAGIVDFASGTFESVKRVTESSEDVRRLRPPRYLHPDNVVRNYSLPQAQGNKLLKEIEKGKYANTDSFYHLEEIIQNREVLLLSNHRVIYGMKSDLFGTWAVQWAYKWEEINMIRASENGLEVTLKKEGKKVMGIFTSVESTRKLILIPQKERRDYLAKIMDNLKQQALRELS